MEHASRVFIRSSFANLVTAASNASLLLVVPAMFVRSLTGPEFAVWALVLQIAGYTGLLTLGLQDAVGRYVAYHQERGDAAAGRQFFDTAFWLLCVAAVFGSGTFAVLGLRLASLFPQVPQALLPFARDMLWAIGVTLCVGLPFVAFSGVLIGLRRNEVVAAVLGTAKFVLTILLGLIAWKYHSLFWLSACFVTVNGLSYVALWAACRRIAGARVHFRIPDGRSLKEVWSYCGTMLVWQISMLMITGLDVIIVGRVDFPALPAYTVSLVPVALLTGAMPALFSPLLQVGASYAARGQELLLGPLLARSTRLATIVLAGAAAMLLLFDRELFTAWLGADLAAKALPILVLVVVGHALRQIAFPYTTLLLSTNQHRQLVMSPIVEGLANVLVAVVAGRAFGAVGVASAVVFGSAVGQLLNYSYNLPRTHDTSFDRRGLVVRSVLLPLLCFVPVLLWAPLSGLGLAEPLSAAVRIALLLIAYGLVWHYAVHHEEKQAVVTLIRGNGRNHA
jgi:O-antigen/teichoic acid export membrane protein